MTKLLKGKATVTGRMFVDTNGDNTELAGNGWYEPGLAGQTVTLVNKLGKVVATTTTDHAGIYTFTNVPGGTYYKVVFPTTVDGMPLVQKGVGTPDVDSDANQHTGKTDFFKLGHSETRREIDAGYADPRTAGLTGRMFKDTDGDNTELAADGNFEPGLPGQTVLLLDGNHNVVATTTTDHAGIYTFTNLPAGTYVVQFPTSVEGRPLVEKDVGEGGFKNGLPGFTIDSDADQQTGKTIHINLQIGQFRGEVDAGYAFGNTDPEANNDLFSTVIGVPVSGNVLTNDTDPDGDTLTVEGITQNPANGTVSIAPNGQFTYTPNPAFSGPDQFTYRISDGKGGFDTAQVFITVRPTVVDGEACQKGAFNLDAYTPIELQVPNAVDGSIPVSNINAQAGDFITFKNAGVTADGTVVEARMTLVSKSSNDLKVDMAVEGRFDEIYGLRLNGNNNNAMEGQTATLRLDFFNQATGQPINFNPVVSFGDLDQERGSEVITINDPNLANVAVSADSKIAINYDGNNFVRGAGTSPSGNDPLSPQDQFAALYDNTNSITFTVTSRGFNSGITFPKANPENLIVLKNDAPDAVDDVFEGLNDAPIVGNLLNNDSDPDKDKICVISNTDPANGTVSIAPNGQFIYTPNPTFTGPDQFT